MTSEAPTSNDPLVPRVALWTAFGKRTVATPAAPQKIARPRAATAVYSPAARVGKKCLTSSTSALRRTASDRVLGSTTARYSAAELHQDRFGLMAILRRNMRR